jgi:V/A-type H+-transporting ATPase subunit I
VLEGFVPTSELESLRSELESRFEGTVAVERVGAERWQGDEPPVVLSNPRLFRPFETLTGLLPLPHYGTIDPTPFVAVFFPMFFGLMLGDVGYGAVLAAVALLLRLRSQKGSRLRAISEVAGACAAFSMLFGLLFGELFGDLGHRWLGLRPLAFDREEAVVPFLLLVVALGLVHVVIGLVLGVVGGFRGNRRHSLGRGLAAVMILIIVTALLAAVGVLPHAFFTPAVVLLLVAFPVLVVLEGVVAPIEFLSTLGNVLSYARIMALGTASVMMAVVANRMVGAFGSIVVGVLFALLFHLVNFALGVFGPTVHALRLHYVEFYDKFYSPGGAEYRPLAHWHRDQPAH